MQSIYKIISKRLVLSAFVACATLALAAPQAIAATSGNATIHNSVTVTYTSGGFTASTTAAVNVTVVTLAAAPSITVPVVQPATTAGTTLTYLYKARSNANGTDDYVPALSSTDTSVSAPTLAVTANPLTLWGGIVLGSPANDTISIPFGSQVGLTAGISTIELAPGQTYTVTTITVGNIASTTTGANAGVFTAETNTTLLLTPIAGANFLAGAVAAGTQVGEFKNFSVDVTAGTPTTSGVTGTHDVVLSVDSTATLADGVTLANTTTALLTTSVDSPSLTITKESRNVTTNTGFAVSGTIARPGEIIEYRTTVTNASTTANATLVSISDAVPVYTTIVAGAFNVGAAEVSITSTIGGVAQATTFATSAADADVANLTGSTLSVNIGAGAASADVPGNGGTILGSANVENVVILYQVTVQ